MKRIDLLVECMIAFVLFSISVLCWVMSYSLLYGDLTLYRIVE